MCHTRGIYISLFVQGRGGLRRELHKALRTGRALRRRRGPYPYEGQGHIPAMVLISARPAEVDDRAIPGHWEGDLILGRGKSAIGTLVERSTRYVMLFPVARPTAEIVRTEMTQKIMKLPMQLRKSITAGPEERRWHNIANSLSTVESKFTSATPEVLGNGAAMKTPTGCFDNIFQKALTFPSIPKQILMPSLNNSTIVLDKALVG